MKSKARNPNEKRSPRAPRECRPLTLVADFGFRISGFIRISSSSFSDFLRGVSYFSKAVVQHSDGRGPRQAKRPGDVNRPLIQAGNGFLIVPAELVVAPTGRGQVVRVLRRKLEFHLPDYRERLRPIRQLGLEMVVQIVVVRMITML